MVGGTTGWLRADRSRAQVRAGGFIGAATLMGLNYGVQRFRFNHQRIDRILEGQATVLIEKGEILHDNLRRELIVAVHKEGILELTDVEKAVLETDGNISVFARTPTPDEARQLAISAKLDRIETALARLSSALPGSAAAEAR